MSSRRRTPLAALLVLGALLLSAGACRRDEVIYIGIAGALTDPVGRPMKLGAELAMQEINAAGGIGGRRLELIERDDFASPDSAVVVAAELYATDVSAVVGHLFSGTTLAAAPVYNGGTDPLVAISPSSSAPEVSNAGPYTFRVCPSDDAHGTALAQWVRERLGLHRGVLLYNNDEYGRGVRSRFVGEFTRRGGELAGVFPYLGSTPDVNAYLDHIAADGGVQFIVLAGNRSEAEEVIRQSRRRGLTLPVLGADGLEGIEQSGGLAEGVHFTMAYLPLLETPTNRKFVAAYRARYPNELPPNQPAAATYDAVHMLSGVMRTAGSDREAVREALLRIDAEAPYEGVVGTIAFDSLGDVPTRQVYMGVVRNGAIRLAGGQ